METQTQEIQVDQITFIERDDPLPPIPLTVAVARAICRPVRVAELVPVPHPERLVQMAEMASVRIAHQTDQGEGIC